MTQERRNNMKAPDKIYLQRVPSNQEVIDGWTVEPVKHTVLEDIEYIRKDALLEWAKEKKKQLLEQESENDEPSDVAAGINAGLDMLIGKLKSM